MSVKALALSTKKSPSWAFPNYCENLRALLRTHLLKNPYDNIVARVWQILCGYQPAGRGEEVVRRKREEYAGYVDQYFNNKEEDIHKDTFRYDRILPSILILV